MGVDLRVGLAAGDRSHVDADEVLTVNPRLIAVSDLVAGLVADLLRELGRVEGAARLDLVLGGEEDLLGNQLVTHHSGAEAIRPECEIGAEGEHDYERRLQRYDPPPNFLGHFNHSLCCCCPPAVLF